MGTGKKYRGRLPHINDYGSMIVITLVRPAGAYRFKQGERVGIMKIPRKISLLVVPPGIFPLLLLAVLAAAAITMAAPEARFASLYFGHPLKGKMIVLDPGHGGIDPGAHHNGMITEKEVVLDVGLELRRLLEQAGAEVIMTRESDQDVSHHIPGSPLPRHRRDLQGRAKIINQAGAALFISIHINSVDDPDVRGAIAFYSKSRPENKLLADIVQKNINSVVDLNTRPGQLMHRHPKETVDYYILNEAEIPGIILEMGFMTSPDDRELIRRQSYRKKLAQAVFLGIVEYVYTR